MHCNVTDVQPLSNWFAAAQVFHLGVTNQRKKKHQRKSISCLEDAEFCFLNSIKLTDRGEKLTLLIKQKIEIYGQLV